MNNIISSLRRVCSQPAFVVVAVILLLAAAGLNAATQYLQLHFRKLAVPPARALTEVPSQLGPWVQVTIDETLSPEFLEALATDKFIFRTYVDSRIFGQDKSVRLRDEMLEFRDKWAQYQAAMENYRQHKGAGVYRPQPPMNPLAVLRSEHPEAVLELGLTYYTGLVDTVAHVPDRCYIADGYEPTRYDVVTWPALAGRKGDKKIRFIVFEDATSSRSSIKRNVAYLFHCNGAYVNDPIEVRKTLANLLQRYGYYMKVELQTINLSPEDSARVMNDFLTSALPAAEACLPDWKALTTAPAALAPGGG